jgi:iron complex outermembrane receptor protein
MNCRPTRRHTLRYAIAMLVALPSAHAAEIEEIVVSDQRRAYRGDFSNLETPQAIQTIDSLIMDQAGVRDLNEALDLSASVARQNNFGGLWNSFAVRGFAGDENLPSNYLVNGFNAGRGFGGSRDISGIEAVEVLKGPTAALFGRGEPGGRGESGDQAAHRAARGPGAPFSR